MNTLRDSIDFITLQKRNAPNADKAFLQGAFVREFSPIKMRSVFALDTCSFRFSEARNGAFSNTVLSLSALKAHDHRPFVVAVVRPTQVEFLLANTTLLKKISHSSLLLRSNNIKGSFNGTDIYRAYENLPNSPENFDGLFALHSAFSWEENVDRLVEATNSIVGRNSRFELSKAGRDMILAAPERAAAALVDPQFRLAELELQQQIALHKESILKASSIDNVNIRGNSIEQILTATCNAHGLGDLVRPLSGGRLVIDVKTKLLDRASAPKAYNIDKLLAFLAEPGSVFAFLMIGVDLQTRSVSARLLPALESSLLAATRVQHHWAGRTSRGVTQLSGQLGRATAAAYVPTVDIPAAQSFLGRLLDL